MRRTPGGTFFHLARLALVVERDLRPPRPLPDRPRGGQHRRRAAPVRAAQPAVRPLPGLDAVRHRRRHRGRRPAAAGPLRPCSPPPAPLPARGGSTTWSCARSAPAAPELLTKDLYATFRADLRRARGRAAQADGPQAPADAHLRRQGRLPFERRVAGPRELPLFYRLFCREHAPPRHAGLPAALPGGESSPASPARQTSSSSTTRGSRSAGVLILLFRDVVMPFYAGSGRHERPRGVDDFLIWHPALGPRRRLPHLRLRPQQARHRRLQVQAALGHGRGSARLPVPPGRARELPNVSPANPRYQAADPALAEAAAAGHAAARAAARQADALTAGRGDHGQWTSASSCRSTTRRRASTPLHQEVRARRRRALRRLGDRCSSTTAATTARSPGCGTSAPRDPRTKVRPLPPQLRPDGGAPGRFRPCPRPRRDHPRRRPAERSRATSAAAGRARRRLRRGLRLAAGPPDKLLSRRLPSHGRQLADRQRSPAPASTTTAAPSRPTGWRSSSAPASTPRCTASWRP